MKQKHIAVAFCAGVAALMSACTTHVSLGYEPGQPTLKAASGNANVRVGTFDDQRKNNGSNEIGSIRGGFGNPLYVLTVDEPVPDIVRKAFAGGMAARGLLSDRPDARFTLAGQVVRLDCNQLMRPEAHADMVVTLSDTATGRVITTKAIQRDAVEGFTLATGAFGSANWLRDLTNQVLRQAVDGALDSPEIVQALSRATSRQGMP
jgi:hypothetical protein